MVTSVPFGIHTRDKARTLGQRALMPLSGTLAAWLILLAASLHHAQAAPNCPDTVPEQNAVSLSNVVLTVEPQTSWRPRGGEVRFGISVDGKAPANITALSVCFGWPPFGNAPTLWASDSVLAVSGAQSGDMSAAHFAARVPNLPLVASAWPQRLWAADTGKTGVAPTTAFGVVPLADMLVTVTLATTPPTTIILRHQVGITSMFQAYAFVLGLLALLVVAARLSRGKALPGNPSLLLWVIQGPDNTPSLSQFQVMLWTLTVAASAVFVMILSGNLVDIGSGTLSLLGIAGGAALLARVPVTATADPPLLPPPPSPPAWSDIVMTNGRIDVTRVQMLIFTLISAAFVVIKVVSSYEIPEIPANFVLLMGLSNGVYATARRLPQN